MARKTRHAAVGEAVATMPRLRQDQTALVAVSGGRDSVALLHALVGAGYRQLVVCHLDHALRPDSDADAWFVADLADRYELPFEADRVPVLEIAEERKLSIEAAGRAARYEFFSQVANALWCPRVILAHHADDQVETMLLNLFRGSGRGGLAAMQPHSVREVCGKRLELHRPLLGVWRDEIAAYAKANRLEYREDASNDDRRFARNRVRHDLLPALATTFGREIKRALLRTATVFGDEEDYLGSRTPHAMPGPLAVAEVKVLPVALQRRMIFAWLESNTIADVGFDDVENVRRLTTALRPAKVNLAGDRHVRRTAGKLHIA
ncbi:MAG: tRNA lysidine(34) synthetase TilS [Chthoniobacteraceae bacterium]